MIIVRLNGGLGNQMFQYVLGRRLALERKCDLALDIASCQRRADRPFLLDRFNIVARLATPQEVMQATYQRVSWPTIGWHFLRTGKLVHFRRAASWVREEDPAHFDNRILALDQKGLYLDGYWQSERYFDTIAEVVRRDLTLTDPLSPAAADMARQLSSMPEAVAVHIRRGDYLANPRATAVHGICPLEYYTTAAHLLAQKLAAPNFLVFSDDPEWCKEHFKPPYAFKVISGYACAGPQEELVVMSHCAHFIIANSTFSWWGAWLSARTPKLVIAPRRWLAQSEIDISTRHPADWVLV